MMAEGPQVLSSNRGISDCLIGWQVSWAGAECMHVVHFYSTSRWHCHGRVATKWVTAGRAVCCLPSVRITLRTFSALAALPVYPVYLAMARCDLWQV